MIELGTIITFICAVVLYVISLVTLWVSVRFLLVSRKIKKSANKYAKRIEHTITMKNNKVASSSPSEIHSYLSTQFALSIIIALNEDVNTKDPKVIRSLYEHSSIRMVALLGDDVIDAISFYHGEGFVMKWIESNFLKLIDSGKLPPIVIGDMDAVAISTFLIK